MELNKETLTKVLKLKNIHTTLMMKHKDSIVDEWIDAVDFIFDVIEDYSVGNIIKRKDQAKQFSKDNYSWTDTRRKGIVDESPRIKLYLESLVGQRIVGKASKDIFLETLNYRVYDEKRRTYKLNRKIPYINEQLRALGFEVVQEKVNGSRFLRIERLQPAVVLESIPAEPMVSGMYRFISMTPNPTEMKIQMTQETFDNNSRSIYLTGRYSLRMYEGRYTGWVDCELSKEGADALASGMKFGDMFIRTRSL